MSTKAIKFTFNRNKAIEAILYIAHKIPDPTYHSINKILYFADKTSLENYGRFVCGDTYFAMKLGPVPSHTYDLMKHPPENESIGFQVEDNLRIVPLREPDLSELSDSDIKCLDSVIALYGSAPPWKRTQDSHDEAWQEAWDRRGDKLSNEMTVESIANLLEDAEDLLEHLAAQCED